MASARKQYSEIYVPCTHASTSELSSLVGSRAKIAAATWEATMVLRSTVSQRLRERKEGDYEREEGEGRCEPLIFRCYKEEEIQPSILVGVLFYQVVY